MVEILTLVKDWELARMRMQNTVEQANADLAEQLEEWMLQLCRTGPAHPNVPLRLSTLVSVFLFLFSYHM